jgi:hypothetical protein
LKEEAEERRRFPLELRLKEAIIGQETAIRNVAAGQQTNFFLHLFIYFCYVFFM